MSLVNLTFGNRTSVTSTNSTSNLNSSGLETEMMQVTQAAMPVVRGDRGRVKIGRVTEFFGRNEICILGELVEGTIAANMMAIVNEKKVEVAELEHKYGIRPLSRPGTKLTLMLLGVNKQDLRTNDVIEFWPPAPKQTTKPKGRIIIC